MSLSVRFVVIIASISCAFCSDTSDNNLHDEETKGDLKRIEPGFGPRSGGTRVTLIGRQLHEPQHGDILAVSLRAQGALYTCTVVEKLRPDRIVVVTPSYRGTEDSVELLLDVRFSNGTQSQFFTSTFGYRPDPVVQGIHPESTILAGGVTLTVSGRNLDSVERPLLVSSAMRRGQSLKRIDNQPAYFVNSTCIKFLTPRIDDVIKANVTGGSGIIRDVTLLVGFLFDGVQFMNYSQLIVAGNPVVEQWDPRSVPFSYEHDETITINVEWPTGVEILTDDITVMIGARRCLNLRRNGTQLVCEPPSVPEPVILNGPETLSKPTVSVRIGSLAANVGVIVYALPGGLHIIIIVMIAILASVVFASLLFGCIACCSSRDKEGKRKHQERSSISYVPVDDLDEMARRRSRVRLSKDSTVDIPQEYQRNRSNSSTSSSSSIPTTGAAGDKGDQVPLHKIEEKGEPGGQAKVIFTDMSSK